MSMVLSLLSGMLMPCAVVGFPFALLHTVLVEHLFLLNFGGRSEHAFVDVHVFNPFAPSNAASSLSACYKKHENIKKVYFFYLCGYVGHWWTGS